MKDIEFQAKYLSLLEQEDAITVLDWYNEMAKELKPTIKEYVKYRCKKAGIEFIDRD